MFLCPWIRQVRLYLCAVSLELVADQTMTEPPSPVQVSLSSPQTVHRRRESDGTITTWHARATALSRRITSVLQQPAPPASPAPSGKRLMALNNLVCAVPCVTLMFVSRRSPGEEVAHLLSAPVDVRVLLGIVLQAVSGAGVERIRRNNVVVFVQRTCHWKRHVSQHN